MLKWGVSVVVVSEGHGRRQHHLGPTPNRLPSRVRTRHHPLGHHDVSVPSLVIIEGRF